MSWAGSQTQDSIEHLVNFQNKISLQTPDCILHYEITGGTRPEEAQKSRKNFFCKLVFTNWIQSSPNLVPKIFVWLWICFCGYVPCCSITCHRSCGLFHKNFHKSWTYHAVANKFRWDMQNYSCHHSNVTHLNSVKVWLTWLIKQFKSKCSLTEWRFSKNFQNFFSESFLECSHFLRVSQMSSHFKMSLSRPGLRSLLHPCHCHGRLLLPPEKGVGVRHRHVGQWNRHLRVGAGSAAAHRAVLVEGGAARPQRLRRQPMCLWGAAPTNHSTGGRGRGGGRAGGVSEGGETWWGADCRTHLLSQSTMSTLSAGSVSCLQ